MANQEGVLAGLRQVLEAAKSEWAAADPSARRKQLQSQKDVVQAKLAKNQEQLASAQATVSKFEGFILSQSQRLSVLDKQLEAFPRSTVSPLATPLCAEVD